MKSNGWHKALAIAVAVVGLAAFATACTKSSESDDSKNKASNTGKVGTEPVNEATKPLEGNPVVTDKTDPETTGDPKAGTPEAVNTDDKGDSKDPVEVKKDPVGANKGTFTSKTVGGDDSYSLQIKYPNEVANGAKGTVTVTVLPAEGWKMNKEFPTKLTVAAPDGVSVAKGTQKVPDAVEFGLHKAVFAVEFTPSSAGSKSFSAKFKFAVCTSSTCDPKKTELAWNTSVM